MAYEYRVNEGVVLADTSATRSEVEGEWRQAFGDDLPTDPSTPQGVMITMETDARDATLRVIADFANQINPDIAGGVFLDAIVAFLGGSRISAERTIINNVLLGGVPGTLIPAGSIASVEATGVRFRTTAQVVLNATGSALATFESVEVGAFPVAVNGLNQVASSVLGWETVVNGSPAIEGRLQESDMALRRRRRSILALQSVATPEAIVSNLNAIEGVRSVGFAENITNAPIVVEGVTLKPHSIYACVDGGADNDVAQSLLSSKTLGADYNGTLHTTLEPVSGQLYDVRFDRPAELTLYVRVTVRPSTLDLPEVVSDALMRYARGDLDGDDGFVIGKDISPFELSGAINQAYPTVYVSLVETSLDGATWSASIRQVSINQVARLTPSRIITVIA